MTKTGDKESTSHVLCLPYNIVMLLWLSMENFLEEDNVPVRGLKDLTLQIEFFLHISRLIIGLM